MKTMRLFGLSSAVALLAACGGPKLVAPNPFPSRAELEKIADSPAKPLPARHVASVQEWSVDAADAESIAERHFATLSDGGELRFTRPLRCVARELARFNAEHGAPPDERVERFILGACGHSSTVASFVSNTNVPENRSAEELLTASRGAMKLPPDLRGKNGGAWIARKDARVALVVVAANGAEALPQVADTTGKVIVRGMASRETEQVIGLVNQGAYGVARCEPDASVPLPQYALTCTLLPEDKWSWVEVVTRSSGRLLLKRAALTVIRREEASTLTLERPHTAGGALPADPNAAILEGLNRFRSTAQLTSLTPAPKQGVVNGKLAPHLFRAELEQDVKLSEELALGLLAGWEVDGTIRGGNYYASLLSGTKDATTWLSYALDSPLGRFTLLDPSARKIAIGRPELAGANAIGAVVTTYSLFESDDHRADAAYVLEKLGTLRATRGLPKPTALGALPTLAAEAKLVNAGSREPMEGLDRALQSETQRLGRSIRGWAILTNDLDVIPYPPELLAAGPLSLGVEVTHFRPEGAPWGAYLVYFIAPALGTQGQVAMTRPRLLIGAAPKVAPRKL